MIVYNINLRGGRNVWRIMLKKYKYIEEDEK